MNQRTVYIIIYLFIVGASLFLVYRFYMRLMQEGGGSIINYALFIGFAIFTYINFKKLMVLFRGNKK